MFNVYKTFQITASLILLFLAPAGTGVNNSGRPLVNGKNSIDSIRYEIKKSGWNDELLSGYSFYLVNSGISFNKELNEIKKLPGTFQKIYLTSLVLKRQYKTGEMFDTLFSILNSFPPRLNYYDELVFSASAENRTAFLENALKKLKNSGKEKTYLSALISSSKGEYKNALALMKNIAEEYPSDKDFLYQLSYIYRDLGDYDASLKTLQELEKLSQDYPGYLAKTLNAAGSLYILSSRYEEASKYYQKVLAVSRKSGDRQNEGKALINLGILEDIGGNIEAGRKYFTGAAAILEKINDAPNQAAALSELGVSYTYTNNLIEAKNSYGKSLSLFKKTGNRLRLSLLLNNIGKIYMNMFDYESALKNYREGIELAGENKRAAALNMTGIADVYANLSNYTKALEYYRKAQKISSEIKEISLEAEINSGLGILNLNLNRFNNALQFFENARSFYSKNGDAFSISDASHKIGITYFLMDSLESAEHYLSESIRTAAEAGAVNTEAQALTGLASVYLKMKKPDKVRQLAARAEKISGENGFGYISAELSLIKGELAENENNFREAEKNFRTALSRAEELNEFSIRIEAYYKLAKLFEKNNLAEGAESFYKSAASLIDDVSLPLFSDQDVQILYFATQREIFESFAGFYINREKYEEAFQLIERSRSRSMIQNLNNLKISSLVNDEKVIKELYELEWMIHSGIYSSVKTDSAGSRLAALKKDLISKEPALAGYFNMKKIPSAAEIRKELGKEENIIVYHLSESVTCAFLLTAEQLKFIDLKLSREELKQLVSGISPYFDYANINGGTFYNHDLFSFNSQAAFNLYRKIVEPVIKEVREGELLIISAPAELTVVPFDFLVASYEEPTSAYSYGNKDYLIYHYPVSYTPSASAYIHQKKSSFPNEEKVLIVGNPLIDNKAEGFAERRGLLEESGGLPRNIPLLPLKYSEEEAVEIGEIINADKILLSNEATESKFKENSEFSRVIHLSTHSYLYNKQPLIFFSNYYDPENDGFLEAGEIVKLRLNSDLVVLSSCNSGLGMIDESEGIVGMSKALFEAGSRSVVVSLWEVNDKYTSALMRLFYRKLSEGHSKTEALRKAKIDFIKDYSPNPYFWSAFILIGDTSGLPLKAPFSLQPLLLIILGALTISVIVIFYIKRKKY